MKSTPEQLKSRGYVEDTELGLYLHYDKEKLIELLSSKAATQRTIASTILSSTRFY